MSTDLKAIMARDERRRRMLNDPDLTGDVLLLAFAFDELLRIRREDKRARSKNWVQQVEELVRTPRAGVRVGFWTKHVLESDIPRYEPVGDAWLTGCTAPMIRREGECGKSSGMRLTDHDPLTGETRRVFLCARHQGLKVQYEARRQEWIANGKPIPAPNAGGVLQRYFDGDWDALYRWAAPYTTPLKGAREVTARRPKFTLIQGGVTDEEEVES